jgi:arylsulfatase A-like enzyme
MKRKDFLRLTGLGLAASGLKAKAATRKPNIIYMMLDELGYYELSGMGHKILKTPNVDRMMSEGMRFTQCLAGGPVCAPTRGVLLTGKHLGHCQVRANSGGNAIRADEITLGEVLKSAGYATGGFGKWGIGDAGSTGVPEKHGFDIFFGYYHQVHAHTYYPRYLVRNSEKVPLKGNTDSPAEGETFSHYLIHDEAIKFIKQNKDHPFFCYLPYTLPHGLWGMPDDDPSWLMYKDMKLGGKGQKRDSDPNMYAAMVNLADRNMGEIMKLLKDLKIDDNTIVFFSGDNGGQQYFKDAEHPLGVFEPNRDVFQGGKGSLREGGLRVPYIVWWPGKIKPGAVSDHLSYFGDVMPTLAELTGATLPPDRDGISFVPTLTGGNGQKQHQYLYWEYGDQVAVREKNWKAYKKKNNWALYDLGTDLHEDHDLSEKHPEQLAKMIAFAEAAHQPIVQGEMLDPSKSFEFTHEKKPTPGKKK